MTTSTRFIAGIQACLLIVGFALACVFYSVGYNLVMLQFAVLGPILCIALAGAGRFAEFFTRETRMVWTALLAIGVLCLHYNLFTVSREASYPFTWVLASLPLVVLALGVMARPNVILIAVAVGVFAMALISDVRFLLDGQRAHDPLADTNNYATLVYLVWIPLTHYLVLRLWQRPQPGGYIVLAIVSAVMTLAIFATASRVGSVVVVSAILAWSVWGVWHKRSLIPVIVVLVAVLFAYFLFTSSAPSLQAATVGSQSLESGVNVRWLMLSSALELVAENGLNGTGLYTFSLLYPEVRSLSDQSTSGVLVHNDYVQLLVEGGVWMLLPVLVLGLATFVALLRSFDKERGLTFAHGCALALAAALVHAMLNFVFYSLVLCFVLGGLVFFALRSDAAPHVSLSEADKPVRSPFVLPAWAAGLVFASCSWFILALDTYAFGVFSGQPSVPSAAATRKDPEAALAYARWHGTLNANRSIPALGEALLLARLPYDETSREATLTAFRAARERHPWSVQTRLALLDYIVTHRISSAHLGPDEQPEALVLQTLADAPADMSVVLQMARFYKLTGRPEVALEHLQNYVFPWIELLFRRDQKSYETLQRVVDDLAPADSPVREELLALRQVLQKVQRDYQPDVWFMRWRSQASE